MIDQSYYETIHHIEHKPVKAIVSLSSGASSAVAADLAIQQFGRGNVELVFMDTLWEDEDNYRFLWECASHWQMPVTVLRDGRTPLQVAEQEHIIPNQKIAPCTHRLKIEPFINHIKGMVDDYNVIVVLGIGHDESHRMKSPKQRYGSIGANVWYPLSTEWRKTINETRDTKAIVKEWGIELPRMYRMGYKHANCAGRCVKQGKRDWRRTLTNWPERYAEVEAWETKMRTDDRFANYAMLRDQTGGELSALPLQDFRNEIEARDTRSPKLWDMVDDFYGCTTECGVA